MTDRMQKNYTDEDGNLYLVNITQHYRMTARTLDGPGQQVAGLKTAALADGSSPLNPVRDEPDAFQIVETGKIIRPIA